MTPTRLVPARCPPAGATARTAARNRYVRAAGAHLAVQLGAVLVLWIMASWHDLDLFGRLTAWDGQWYLDLARHGYGGVADLDTDPSFPAAPLAFFPLFPMLTSLAATLPLVNITAGAILVSLTAGSVAACGLLRLADHIDGRRRVGMLLVVLHAGAPMAITFSMSYTEALFVAFAVWSLVGVLERNWLLAGVSCAWAGFTRSTASVLIIVVMVAALIAVWRGRDRRQALACAVMCPAGLAGYWTYVAVETGSLTGWQDIEERGWGLTWDWGARTVQWFPRALMTEQAVMTVGVAALLIIALTLTIRCARIGLPWPLVSYAAGVVALVIGTAGLEMTKARLLLPAACVLLIPVAVRLADRRRARMVGGAAAIVAPAVWYSAQSLTIWPLAI